MQSFEPNDVKIYNLSAGKSLPEWLSDRKRRALLKKNADIKKRIELIQDFDMPVLSNSIKVSKDGNYILTTGIYKPRVKCFDVNNLSLKFERCFDSEAITFEVLSDDFSKMVFLQCDRYIEFHVAHGRHQRLRIPRFGRDMQYHYPSCDLFLVGASADIYRFNLERGQFMTPFTSPDATEINKCAINPEHDLLVCGTQEGKVEAWDPRVKANVGVLDCGLNCLTENKELKGVPSITALKFHDSIHLGVGTITGEILLYDIRSSRPFIVKEHMNDQPIKDIDFHYQQNLVYSLDRFVLKIWDKNTGKLYTSIGSPKSELNSLCVVPNTGLFFLANESPKIQTYYIPSLGPAPKWAGFLDSLTEELEESNFETIYDDYKFITTQELHALGLEHLIGTTLLRAYLHGYFIDIRLYKKAKALVNPFAFEDYRKQKIRETIVQEREDRVPINKLPKVNKDLALKLMTNSSKTKRKETSTGSTLLEDDRFKALFENTDFEINKNADEYRLLNPVLSRSSKIKELKDKIDLIDDVQTNQEKEDSDNSSIGFSSSEEDSADERNWKKEVQKQHRQIKKEHQMKERLVNLEEIDDDEPKRKKQPKLYGLKHGEEFKGMKHLKRKSNKKSFGERLQRGGF